MFLVGGSSGCNSTTGGVASGIGFGAIGTGAGALTGKAGVVLSKGSLTTKQTGEYEIRKAMLEDGVIDCIVNMPTKLFLNTQIPACLWFLNRGKNRQRKGEVLFIDARNLGFLVNRKTREFTNEDLAPVSYTHLTLPTNREV
mgnify:CR=1 FL=1